MACWCGRWARVLHDRGHTGRRRGCAGAKRREGVGHNSKTRLQKTGVVSPDARARYRGGRVGAWGDRIWYPCAPVKSLRDFTDRGYRPDHDDGRGIR